MQSEKLKNVKEKLKVAKTKFKKKYLFIAMGSVLIIAMGAIVWQIVFAGDTESGGTPQVGTYQEETVILGDIVVGISETSSVNMDENAVSLDFATIVSEVYVPAGSYVQAGDPLLKIDTEHLSELMEEAENELELAQLQLEKTIIDSNIQTANADWDYDSTIQDGANASTIYSTQMAELDQGYADILAEITSLESQKATLENQIAQGTNATLTKLNTELADINTQISTVTDQLNHASTCPGPTDPTCTAPSDSHDVTALQASLDQLNIDKAAKETEIATAQTDYDKTLTEWRTQLSTATESLTKKYTERDNYAAGMSLDQQEIANQYNATMQEYSLAESEYNSAMIQLETTLMQAQESVDALSANFEMFEELSEDGVVTAPQAGYIFSISQQGDELQAGGTLATLADSDMIYLEVSIPQEDIADITIGMQTTVILDAYDDVSIPGTVQSISFVPGGAMQSSVNYTVTVACSTAGVADITIYQGMTAEVTFVQKQVQGVMIISNKCISTVDGKQYVKVFADDGSVKDIEVQTGFSDGFDVEIISGLSEGDIVLIENVVMSNETE